MEFTAEQLYTQGYNDAWHEGAPLSDHQSYLDGWYKACADAKKRNYAAESDALNNNDLSRSGDG